WHAISPAAIHRLERLLARDEMQGCPALAACLRYHERSRFELQQRKAYPAGRLRAFGKAAQPAGDHQVQNEEQLALQGEHDPLAEAAQADDLATFHRADRRIRGAQQKRVEQHDPAQGPALDVRAQALQVDGDIRQLGHLHNFTLARNVAYKWPTHCAPYPLQKDWSWKRRTAGGGSSEARRSLPSLRASPQGSAPRLHWPRRACMAAAGTAAASWAGTGR